MALNGINMEGKKGTWQNKLPYSATELIGEHPNCVNRAGAIVRLPLFPGTATDAREVWPSTAVLTVTAFGLVMARCFTCCALHAFPLLGFV